MTSELKHIGTPRHSGRYPWGSGKDPNQRNTSWLGKVHQLHKQGLSDDEIAKGEGLSINEFRKKRTIEIASERKYAYTLASRLREKGMSYSAIGRRMGRNESSIRALLDPTLKERSEITENIANALKECVSKDKYIDIGVGSENHLGISRTKLMASVQMLKDEGYKVHYINAEQQGTGKNTRMIVLTAPNVPYEEVSKNKFDIKMVVDTYSEDGGRSFLGLEPVESISRDRVYVRYAEDGGKDKDGTIELKRGVADISLGGTRYAQVRIGVDGTHYMKGMAVYTDNVPEGKDIIYNTNKKKSEADKVFKKMEKDPDNPFGSAIRQRHYLDANGVSHLSLVNKIGSADDEVNEEGKWETWKRALSSQVLSKQNPDLAKKQLGLSYDLKKEEFNEIMSLTNPAIKKRLLTTFADGCDKSAVDLDAAALPRQSSHVLISIPSIKEKEVYAPGYDNGENVVLIRHPHGGIFEIPELIVNNNNKDAIDIIGKDSRDAVGIHPKVAAKLSGADFDGDAVIVIPNKNNYIKTKSTIKSLQEFDPREQYKLPDDAPRMTPRNKELQMGVVSNLITDMTIKGASDDEIVRAVKHSMVVIDAEKQHLDYKRSAIEHDIPALKKKYQGSEISGASTIISRAGSQKRVPLRKDEFSIDPVTGKKVYKYITGEIGVNARGNKVRLTTPSLEIAKKMPGETYISRTYKEKIGIDSKTGKDIYKNIKVTKDNYDIAKASPWGIKEKVVRRTTLTTKMAEEDDAFKLSSGKPIENVYALHANKLKSLANNARKASLEAGNIVYSKSASIIYKKEVQSLESQLNLVYRNKPLERKAQLLAGKIVSLKRQNNPQIEPGDLKKIRGQAITEQRIRISNGKDKRSIIINDKEWEAIQSGAISNNRLNQILLNTDLDALKQRAMPRTTTIMSPARIARAKSMRDNGYTSSDIANLLGVSVSTLSKAIK
jgi:hypothetical protein